MFDDENMAEKIGNQKEESDNSEISNDSNKQTLEDSSKVPSKNSSAEEVKIPTDQNKIIKLVIHLINSLWIIFFIINTFVGGVNEWFGRFKQTRSK